MFPRGVNPKSATDYQLTPMNYHLYKPNFSEEIKIVLPRNLDGKCHLFFTFIKLSVKKTPGKTLVCGHALLPLYFGKKIIEDKVYKIPVAQTLPKNYLSFYQRRDKSKCKFMNGGADLFQLKIRVESTLHCKDVAIGKLFDKLDILFKEMEADNEPGRRNKTLGFEILSKASGNEYVMNM